MVAVGEGILAPDQVRALVARTLEQIAAQCLPPSGPYLCARAAAARAELATANYSSYQNGPPNKKSPSQAFSLQALHLTL